MYYLKLTNSQHPYNFYENVVNTCFTLDELFNKNINGRVRHGVPKGRINPDILNIALCSI